ncbi:hypothetical protein [uncultured Deefgea sp.]|uniref:hypothetical protein n=1 Tax=uncultured Deefgea sp. TaxID=1304914 RepID=UPI00260F3F1B|nr:hypothetical protein [uncultured Deefgea sp.]
MLRWDFLAFSQETAGPSWAFASMGIWQPRVLSSDGLAIDFLPFSGLKSHVKQQLKNSKNGRLGQVVEHGKNRQ